MNHVAIMKKSWGLTQKIFSGEKKIESRWYKFKHSPWNKIKAKDVVYFKNSGEPVSLKAKVSKVLQFSNLTSKKVKEILNDYGKGDGLDKRDIPNFYKRFRNKKYCILVFLKDPKMIKPFKINKKGFGSMAAWITIKNVRRIAL